MAGAGAAAGRLVVLFWLALFLLAARFFGDFFAGADFEAFFLVDFLAVLFLATRFFGDFFAVLFAAFLFFAIELAPSVNSARVTSLWSIPKGAYMRGETSQKNFE